MANSLAEMRKAKGKIENLQKEIEKMNSSESKEDTRFWQPTVDKAGNGYAVIRFLPASKGEDLPWVQIWSHGFQGPNGKWYIENSLTTLGQSDPVSDLNSRLWNSGNESDKDIVRKQKRKLNYIANIMVVKDPENPQNDGQVFLYKFGSKIFDKIKDAMKPEFEDEKAINPFDFWEGADFKLKIRKVEGYRNYDKSEFDSPSPISKDDDAIEAIWKKQYALKEFLDPSNFKTYDELQAKLNRVLESGPVEIAEKATAPAPRRETAPKAEKATASSMDDDDSGVSYFEKLAAED